MKTEADAGARVRRGGCAITKTPVKLVVLSRSRDDGPDEAAASPNHDAHPDYDDDDDDRVIARQLERREIGERTSWRIASAPRQIKNTPGESVNSGELFVIEIVAERDD